MNSKNENKNLPDIEIWLRLFNSICLLHATPNSPRGAADCAQFAHEEFYQLMGRKFEADL